MLHCCVGQCCSVTSVLVVMTLHCYFVVWNNMTVLHCCSGGQYYSGTLLLGTVLQCYIVASGGGGRGDNTTVLHCCGGQHYIPQLLL